MKQISLLLLIGYCGLIFYLSHQPTLPVEPWLPHQDKLFHLIAYAGLAYLAINYFQYHTDRLNQAKIVSVLFCAFYGLSDEWHQSFVAGRDADIYDWFADVSGAALLLLAARKSWFFKGVKKPQ